MPSSGISCESQKYEKYGTPRDFNPAGSFFTQQ